MKLLSLNDSWIYSSSNISEQAETWQHYFESMFFIPRQFLSRFIFVFCFINLIGAFLKIKLKDSQFPLPIILFVIGCTFEILSFSSFKVEKFTERMQWMNPVVFINLFTPVIIFSVSFDTDFYMLQKLFWQILILTVPGFFLNYILVDWYLKAMNKLNLENTSRVLFALILICTDPMQTTSAIKKLGLSKGLTHLIKGECILLAAFTENAFRITINVADSYYKGISTKLSIIVIKAIMKKFLGSTVFGFASYKMFQFVLRGIFNDDITEGMLSFSIVYINFYVAEWTGMSGIVSLTVSALLLNSTSFKSGDQLFLFKFWKSIRFFASLMIFTLVGMLVPAHAYLHITLLDLYYVLHLYFILIVIRILIFLILSPILSRLGYGFTWRWAFTIVWSEMRGLLNINMALILSYSDWFFGTEREKSQILLYGVAICLITLSINSITLPRAAIHLGLRDITLTKRKSLHYTVKYFQEITKNVASALKFDRDLANADWNLVDKKITFQNPYKLTPEEIEHQKLKCAKCNKEVADINISTEIMELARVRLLSAQIASYERQYANEVLSQSAVKVLVGAAGSLGDKKGEFLSFQTMQVYAEKKKMFNFFRNILFNWIYNSKREKGVAPKNPILLFCHKIMVSDEFEYTGYLVIILNMIPLLFSWMPQLNLIYDNEIHTIRYPFLFFYILEIIFKIIAMRKRFFLHIWNLFELAITLFTIIEEVINTTENISISHSQLMLFLKIVPLLRIFRLLKLITPVLLQLMNRRMSHQLSFRYAMLKGYVQGEADIACVIDQIASSKAVAQVLRNHVYKNAENAMKELGYLEYDHPDIAITMKTKEEIYTLLNMAEEILMSLETKGIISNTEVSVIRKEIFARKKEMFEFEPVIKLPSLDEMLYNIPWLSKSNIHIDYIKEKINILTFDCGNNIFEEGDDMTGIYLIISGNIKRQSSRPFFGMNHMTLETEPTNHAFYADYLNSGAIIGELNCLTNEPVEFTATCKTVVEAYFIPKYHLYDTFKECCPSIEYKIWLKLALGVGAQKVKEILAYEDWSYNLHLQLCNVYVRDVPKDTKANIYDETVNYVILVYGSAEDCQLQKVYFAPTLIPKTCHQIQGTAKITKILVIQTSADLKKCRSNIKLYVPVCKHVKQKSRVNQPKSSTDSFSDLALPSEATVNLQKHMKDSPTDIRVNLEALENF
ncbi:solute carrier family 9 member C1 [Macrotis lagotis]|uniref:solute carrier family 9 member C1 n=1 Tax=Macrotis lagotis TaxID=92651 RepID=UPI003D68B488